MSTQHSKPSAASLMGLIVKRELGQYLGTWSGYIVFAALLLATGLFYNVESIGSSPKYSSDVLSDFFKWASGFTVVTGILLAMRLIAEERQNGTLPLLTTSSLTEGQIILAKYFSAMVMICIYVTLSLYMPFLVFQHGAVSLGHIFAGCFGMVLIGSAGVAIGMFGSALFRSQLVAAILAGVIALVMTLLWALARVVEGVLGEIIGQITLHDKHFSPFMDGTITLPNIVYYLSVTAVFLLAARNLLEARRWRM
jgi:ABC-2 type transport system permease protein